MQNTYTYYMAKKNKKNNGLRQWSIIRFGDYYTKISDRKITNQNPVFH